MQIGDENVHLVRSLLDEVFGSENFDIANHVWQDVRDRRMCSFRAL